MGQSSSSYHKEIICVDREKLFPPPNDVHSPFLHDESTSSSVVNHCAVDVTNSSHCTVAYVKVAAAVVYPARFVFNAVFSSQSRIRRPHSANVDSSLSR